VALTQVGAEGVLAGVAVLEDAEADEVPALLVAVTLK
jgi:hypothetical protein